MQVSAAEFILEGLYAHKRIGRTEEREVHRRRKASQAPEKEFEREELFRGEREDLQLVSAIEGWPLSETAGKQLRS